MVKETQGEFPVVKEMTVDQKKAELTKIKERIALGLAAFSHEDNDVVEGIASIIDAMVWLKINHDNEGSISHRYKKKKNVHGGAEGEIAIKATFKESIKSDEEQTTVKEFLSKSFPLASE